MGWNSGKALASALAGVVTFILVVPAGRAADAIAACAEAGALFATAEAVGARDGMTIRLADGREVRLAGVIAANDLDGDAEAVERATRALDQAIAGRQIRLHGRAESQDRYGRLVAQVAIEGGETSWVQAALVAAGMLRVAPVAGEPACAKALIVHERAARSAHAGLWALSRFAVQEAGSIAMLAAAGLDLRTLVGNRVRARGILVSWGGPAVEVRLPVALELLDRDGA